MGEPLGRGVLTLALLALGCDPAPCPDGFLRRHEDTACIPIATLDAGSDSGPGDSSSDAGPCGMVCGGSISVCDETSGMCVQCTAANTAACIAPTDLCVGGSCVQCETNAECGDLNFPICGDDGTCRGCGVDTECAATTDAPVCHEASGRCVACTPDTETTTCPSPGNQACHPTDLTCTGAERGSLGFCQACVSDSECITNASGTNRCIPMDFESTAHGTYCLIDQTTLSPAGPCPDRMTTDRLATSVGGTESTYCFLQENLTTCEAVLGFNDLCPGGDGDCGATGLDDGHCDTGTCTYECSGGSDCGSGTCSGAPTTYCE